MNSPASYFYTKKDYGSIFLRLVIGWRLIAGSWNYALHSKPINEVSGFFKDLHLPVPLLSAYLSVYSQCICAILFILGLWVRPAAAVMIINFTVAIIAAHLGEGIERSFAAWIILAASFSLLFYGAGKVSLDDILHNRHTKSNNIPIEKT